MKNNQEIVLCWRNKCQSESFWPSNLDCYIILHLLWVIVQLLWFRKKGHYSKFSVNKYLIKCLIVSIFMQCRNKMRCDNKSITTFLPCSRCSLGASCCTVLPKQTIFCPGKRPDKPWKQLFLPCSPFVQFCIKLVKMGSHVCVHCPCLGFSRWNHGMEVISHPIPLWTVIRCRQCAMDPKGLPSAYFCSFQRWEISNHHLVDVLAMCAT